MSARENARLRAEEIGRLDAGYNRPTWDGHWNTCISDKVVCDVVVKKRSTGFARAVREIWERHLVNNVNQCYLIISFKFLDRNTFALMIQNLGTRLVACGMLEMSIKV